MCCRSCIRFEITEEHFWYQCIREENHDGPHCYEGHGRVYVGGLTVNEYPTRKFSIEWGNENV